MDYKLISKTLYFWRSCVFLQHLNSMKWLHFLENYNLDEDISFDEIEESNQEYENRKKELEKLKKKDLVVILQSYECKITGNKDDLIKRIIDREREIFE